MPNGLCCVGKELEVCSEADVQITSELVPASLPVRPLRLVDTSQAFECAIRAEERLRRYLVRCSEGLVSRPLDFTAGSSQSTRQLDRGTHLVVDARLRLWRGDLREPRIGDPDDRLVDVRVQRLNPAREFGLEELSRSGGSTR